MLNVQVRKKLWDFTLDIQFSVGTETLVLFGPSGCGKTTILRCIAGITKPDEGNIIFDNQVFYCSQTKKFLPPRIRQVGYMFQEYALFPHMNVKKNIWYGVKHSTEQSKELYNKLISLLKIEHLSYRYTSKLSGGEKQRVALARALMAEPKILLLDEPLSALDNETRFELQAELKKMQGLWNIPFILVTHDSDEAKALGDEIVFLKKAR